MKRFLVSAGLMLLAGAAVIAYRLSATAPAPAADFDVLGILWLLENFPRLILWACVWSMILLGLACFWRAHRWSGRRQDLASEQQRLIGHLLVDPIRKRGVNQVDAPPPDPAGR